MKFLTIILTVSLICSCALPPPPVKSFTVDLRAPRHTMGKMDAYFDKMLGLGGLRKDEVNVYYYPTDDAAGLQFDIQLAECYLFLDESGRDTFLSAFERYKGEFEQRTLVTKGKKTRETYGSVEGFLAWKRTKISVQAYGNAKIYFGYQFRDNAAYFTITQMEANYEDEQARSRSQTSQIVMIYLTRAQAEKLVAMFNHEFITGLRLPGAMPDIDIPDLDRY